MAQKSAENANFWYKFAPKAIFTKFCLWEGAPGPLPHAKLDRCGFKNVAIQPQKSSKMVITIFGTKLPLGKNSGGR